MEGNPISQKSRHKAEGPLYVSYKDPALDGGESFAKAAESFSNGVNEALEMTRAYGRDTWRNVAPNTSVREETSHGIFDYMRPGQSIPTQHKEIVEASDAAYRGNGMVHQTIDMMADLCVKGMDVVSSSKTAQKFYKAWWKYVHGSERAERIANYLPRKGTVVVKRTFSNRLSKKEQEKLEKGQAALFDELAFFEKLEVPGSRQIPLRYDLLNILDLEPIGGELAPFVGEMQYALKLPPNIVRAIKSAGGKKNPLVDKIPAELVAQIKQGKNVVILPPDKITALHYKKDDDQIWADPMVYPVLGDLITLERLKLADRAALDGAISYIRIWKLGDLESRLFPSDAGIAKLSDILLNNGGGGPIDIIWGPDLQLEETSTDLSKFLGDAKYGPTLNAIYAGLGIPPTLTGSTTQSGYTNNFISLQTLVERLNYIRNILISFWDHELRLVQKAMGFRAPAQIIFDMPVLSDPSAELALIIQLVDRGIISEEAAQERFRFSPDLELSRTKREARERNSGKRNPKLGPYPQLEDELKKAFVPTGSVTPSELGIELEEPTPGEVKPALLAPPTPPGGGPSKTKKKGASGQGRPKNSKDASRKKKRVLPRSKAAEFSSLMVWTKNAQKVIADTTHGIYLEMYGKQNLRQLSNVQAEALEELKFAVLCGLKPYQEISEETIVAALEKDLSIPRLCRQLCSATLGKFTEKHTKQPSLDDVRQIQAGVYVLWNLGDDDGEDSD